jgi:hypothetical protein
LVLFFDGARAKQREDWVCNYTLKQGLLTENWEWVSFSFRRFWLSLTSQHGTALRIASPSRHSYFSFDRDSEANTNTFVLRKGDDEQEVTQAVIGTYPLFAAIRSLRSSLFLRRNDVADVTHTRTI